MPRRIPSQYNFETEGLDATERYIRDDLQLDVLRWQHFRFAVNSGTDTRVLVWNHGVAPSNDVKQAYLDMGKSHHEAICCLGFMKMSLDAAESNLENMPLFKEQVKAFYFHSGCFLDNLARVIYIVANYSMSATEPTNATNPIKLRRYMDWGSLHSRRARTELADYRSLIDQKKIKEIQRVRNAVAHSWLPVFQRQNGRIKWPKAVRVKRDYYWPYDVTEIPLVNAEYRGKVVIIDMMRSDFNWLYRFQSRIFRMLKKDFKRFETHHGFRVGN